MLSEKLHRYGRVVSVFRGASVGCICLVAIVSAASIGYSLGVRHANKTTVTTDSVFKSTRVESGLGQPGTGTSVLDVVKPLASRQALLHKVVEEERPRGHSAYGSDPLSMLRGIANALPDALEHGTVSRFIARNSPFGEDDLVGVENPIAFGIRMAEVSMSPLGDGVSPPPEEKRSMRFVDADQLEKDPVNEHSGYFFEDVGRVYGLYSLPDDYDRPNVLVSWRNTTTGDRMRFRKMSVTSARTQLLSFQPSEQWLPGTYQVAVFSTHESLDVISFGNYEIYEG